MNEYQTRLINLRIRKVTANNFFTLSELVDDYDKLVEELMEDKEELKTKENKTLKFEYKGYQLELDVTLDKEGSIYWKATCNELSNFSFCFSPGFYRSLEGAISKFKQEVDRFFITNEIEAKKNMTTTEQDPDVILANQFSDAIDNLIEEILPLIDAKNLYYIINLKLKRLFEEFKDTVLYDCSFDGVREMIIDKLRKIKREEDKKEQSTYNWVTRKELYKLNLTTHNLIKILTVDENGIPQFYWTPSNKFPEKPNTYSPNWYYKEGSTYFIYTKPVNIQEIKIDQYVTGFVNPDGKVVYYDQYL